MNQFLMDLAFNGNGSAGHKNSDPMERELLKEIVKIFISKRVQAEIPDELMPTLQLIFQEIGED